MSTDCPYCGAEYKKPPVDMNTLEELEFTGLEAGIDWKNCMQCHKVSVYDGEKFRPATEQDVEDLTLTQRRNLMTYAAS